MLKEFWENERLLLQITAFFVAAAGLFLNIESPSDSVAKGALSNIQAFFLISILICLARITFKQIRFALTKNELMRSVLLILIGTSSLWLSIYLLIFILSLYQYSIAKFVIDTSPILVLVPSAVSFYFLDLYSKFLTRLTAGIILGSIFAMMISPLSWWIINTTPISNYLEWNNIFIAYIWIISTLLTLTVMIRNVGFTSLLEKVGKRDETTPPLW